jgi:hypothetical protein
MEIVFDFEMIMVNLNSAERKLRNDLSLAMGTLFWIFGEEQRDESTGNDRR